MNKLLRWGWAGRPPQPSIAVPAAAVALVVVLPLIYVLYRAATGGLTTWQRLLTTRLPQLLLSSLSLTVAVVVAALVVALPLAWLAARTDIPGRRTWRWLFGLPLVFPPYVGAFSYITVFGPRGVAEKLTGWSPDVYSFPAVALVMALFTFPYIFLLAAAALENADGTLEEAGRLLGLSPVQVLWRVTLPLVRPAAAAGALLVALYVLSDFGAVTMLRYSTFTSAIYLQLVGRYDRSAAAVLSGVLAVLTAALLWGEGHARRRIRFYQVSGSARPLPKVLLGAWRWPASLWVIAVCALSVALPGIMLLYWTVRGVAEAGLSPDLARYFANSLFTAGIAATLATLLGLPVAYLSGRHRGPLVTAISLLSRCGYVLPGVVVALSLVFFVNRFLPVFYGTFAVLVAALVLRFLPQGVQAMEAVVAQIPPSLEEASRTLGRNSWRTWRGVTLPLAAPGVTAGWALMFISAMKELPATLLLRPAGFDTLAVRVWIDASEGFYNAAAPAALLLVAASGLALRYTLSGSAPPNRRKGDQP